MNIKKAFSCLIAGMVASAALAANTVTTISQVTDGVSVSDDVDYTITGTTPFSTSGSVDITNIDHAVVIFQNIRPSDVIKSYMSNVFINGAKAVNNSNCQVKMYGRGTIILPYTTTGIQPLTLYPEQDFKGTAVSISNTGNSGGYMNTLTAAQLNNSIRSFKLKRGYMVTFSTRAGGRGYSRCFIASDADLEISSLPTILDGTISSYRLFVWNEASKKNLGNDLGDSRNYKLGSTSSYTWGVGESHLPDMDCVVNHIYEDYPSSSACGNQNFSCMMKTNNEPGNSSDDHPQDVATVLNNWENLMRTGLRLCSETSHDGSWSHLRAFIDSVDARGWRCDLLDLHCYWDSGFSTGNMANYYNNYGKRPILISEWVWGASWNRNGIFADGKTQQDNANRLKEILPALESSPYVERYYYWNSEADISKLIYTDGTMTEAGKYYASVKSNIGYNKSAEKIPNLPPMKNTAELTAGYDKEKQSATLKWRDYNGEYNKSMVIQEQPLGSTKWEDVKTVTLKEQEAIYYDTIPCKDGSKFRIVLTVPTTSTGNASTTLTGNIVTARASSQEYGDPVSVVMGDSTVTRYLGGNMFINGDFSMGTTDWTAGDGNTISLPYFQVMPEGGSSGSPYLQCYGNSILTTNPQTIYRRTSILPKTCYYVAGTCLNSRKLYQNFSTNTGTVTATVRMQMNNATTTWARQSQAFYNESDENLNLKLSYLGVTSGITGNAQFDDLMACQLFDTKEAALADALVWEKKRVEAYISYNTLMPAVNSRLKAAADTCTDANELESILLSAMDVVAQYKQLGNTVADAGTVISLGLTGSTAVESLLTDYNKVIADDSGAYTYEEMQKVISDLSDNVNDALPYTLNTTSITNGSFAASTGWTTKAGTFTGGDQSLYTKAGKTCWNAWWSTPAGDDKTMAIKQQLTGVDEGLYSLECKALTEHACETDQHAFISYNGTETASEPLDFGCLDIATFADDTKWRQMATPYIYLYQGSDITVGFTGSKEGAVDNSWIAYGASDTKASRTGDNREGWWCATDFKLRYIPAITKTPEGQWGIVCFQYAITPQEDVKMYSLLGISADSMYIYVKPETSFLAGKPYIYYTTKDKAMFTGSGTKKATPTLNLNLYGTYTNTTTKYGTMSCALVNGEWIYNPGTTTLVPDNSGYIRFLSSLKVPATLPEGTVKMPLKNYRKSVYGDANGDQLVNNLDIDTVVKVIGGDSTDAYIPDVNGDGSVDVIDANIIISIIVSE